jgi:outer membrane receptor protein involved in Fe transport
MSVYRTRLLATTWLISAGLLASPAWAQEVHPAEPSTDSNSPAAPMEAQPAPEMAAANTTEQARDIVVTGTRIPSANLQSVAPVTVVSSQDFKLSGTTRVEDLLNSLPSIGASQTSGMSNGASGTAEVDLRYLGSKRTLTLVNGRRLAPGDPNSPTQAADLNMIPSAIVKRAEVLTGGASSTYGADAVAGVVNFIMDTEFTGIRFDGQYSFYNHNNTCPGVTNGRTVCDALDARIGQGLDGYGYPGGSVTDGGTFDGTLAIGTSFDDNRGHVMAYFGYRKVNAVTQDRRDFSTCAIGNAPKSSPIAGQPICTGSATSAEGNALLFNDDVTVGSSTVFTFGPNRTLDNGITLYNFNPWNYFQRPDERYIAGAFANYEITPAIKPYLEFMFMDDFTKAQIAPSGNFGNTFTLNCDNPFMSAQARDEVVCTPENMIVDFIGNFPVAAHAPYNPDPNNVTPIDFVDSTGTPYRQGYFNLLRRNVEGGPRISELTHTNFRGVIGTKGDLSNVWSYDAYYQYGRTNYSQVYRNEFSASRLNRALNVILDPRVGSPTEGQPICRSVLDGSDPNCVPYDIFSTPSEAAVNYLNVFGVIEGKTSEQVANINFTGALGDWGVQTPWAEDGVGVNVGFEYRKESLSLNPDQSFQAGDLTGQGAPTLAVDGEFDVKEWFGEIQIPIVQQDFIHDLSLSAGYRKSWYSTHSNTTQNADRKYDTDTYKVGLEFAPIRDVRFRAAYNRSVRAPNIQELFAPQFVGLDGSTDPCGSLEDANGDPRPVGPTDYGCLAQGLQVNQSPTLNPAEQYNGLVGGNPNLNPEKATTKTLGVILEPRFLPRFALTIDYWTIKVDGAIQGFGADTILQDCIDKSTATTVAPSCDLIHRNAAGSLWLSADGYVIDTPTNVGGIKTSGFDFNASYSHRLGGLGNLSATFVGTLMKKYVTDNGLAEPYDCTGLYGATCSGGSVSSAAPMPKWRHKARTTLQMSNGIGLSLQWRMMGKVAHESKELGGGTPILSDKVKAQHYLDWATTYSFGDHYSLRVGVNNLLDNDPPLMTSSFGSCPAGSCNGNTYPGTWDALGRYVYAGVTLDF